MNKGIIIAVVAILVLIGGGIFVANQNSQNAEQANISSEEGSMMQKDKTAMEDDKMMAKPGGDERYVEYTKTVLDQVSDNRRVLYFYASWCPTCRPADADFKQNTSRIPEDVTVIRVNYNDPETDQEEKDLAKQYGITYQHTFVQIDGQGKEVTKWNGGQTDELLANIK